MPDRRVGLQSAGDKSLDPGIFPFNAWEFDDPSRSSAPKLSLRSPWVLETKSGLSVGGDLAVTGNLSVAAIEATGLIKGLTLESTVSSGTPPLAVVSSDEVANFNAEFVGGYSADELRHLVGEIKEFAGIAIPSGWLLCNGSAVSRTTYAALFGVLTVVKGAFTVTVASPGVVTKTGHGLSTGDCVSLTTTGALPTGLSAETNYFVIKVTDDTFRLATSFANASAGTAINTSGTQSGTHTLRYNPWGISGASNFLLPDCVGASAVGAGTSTGYTENDTVVFGAKYNDRIQGHWHNFRYNAVVGGSSGAGGYIDVGSGATNSLTPSVDSNVRSPITDGTNGTPRAGKTTRGKIVGMNFIIKY